MTVYYALSNGMEIIDNTEHSFNRLQAIKRTETRVIKRKQKEKAYKKRKQKIEEIKLTLTLSFFMIIFPFLMFLHWLVIGY